MHWCVDIKWLDALFEPTTPTETEGSLGIVKRVHFGGKAIWERKEVHWARNAAGILSIASRLQ